MDRYIYDTCSSNSLLQSMGPYRILNTGNLQYQLRINTVSVEQAPIIINNKDFGTENVIFVGGPQEEMACDGD